MDLASYICEIALYWDDFVSTKHSIMAKASLALARVILGKPEPNDGELVRTENATLLAQYLHSPSDTLIKKYSSWFCSRVSGKLSDFLLAQQAPIAWGRGPPIPYAWPNYTEQVRDVYSTPYYCNGSVSGAVEGFITPLIIPRGVWWWSMGTV